MAVDTRFVVEQFALCSRFAAMGQTKSDNSLLPQSYGRVQTNYLKQNRKETFACAYADVNKSYTFPESLQILASSYLECTLPLNGAGNYKSIPGLWIIDKFYLRCNGDLVYSGCYQTLLSDHIASLTDEDARAYVEAYMRVGPREPCSCPSLCLTVTSGDMGDEAREPTLSLLTATTRLRSPLIFSPTWGLPPTAPTPREP